MERTESLRLQSVGLRSVEEANRHGDERGAAAVLADAANGWTMANVAMPSIATVRASTTAKEIRALTGISGSML